MTKQPKRKRRKTLTERRRAIARNKGLFDHLSPISQSIMLRKRYGWQFPGFPDYYPGQSW